MLSNCTLEHLSQRNKNICSHRVCTNVHSRFIRNCSKLEMTQIVFNGWMVKQSLVYLYNGILLGDIKYKETHFWYMQQFGWISRELWRVKKVLQKVIYCMIPLCNILKWQNYRNREQINDWRCERSKSIHKWPTGRIFLVMEIFCILIVSISISWLWYHTKILQDVTSGGTWLKRYKGSFYIISYNCIWIYNYFKIRLI